VAAHAADLRAEVEHERAQEQAAGREPGGPAGEAFAADIAAQGSEAAPTPRLRALLQYVERVALQPASVTAEHVQELRAAGLDDRAIHDAAQIAAYFSYINRVADGLGVDLEPEMERERDAKG